MESSRAVKLTAHAGRAEDIYELVRVERPRAAPGTVVVRMTAMPVHPTDLRPVVMWAGLGLEKITLGGEGAGVVAEVGKGVTRLGVGQRVVPVVFNRFLAEGYGVWRDFVEIPEADAIPVPDDIPDDLACQLCMNLWLVYGILEQLGVPRGEYLVQNAAGSVVGRQIVQLAKHWGIKTINVVRRNDHIGPLKALGADEVINSSLEDVPARVMEITRGKGAYGGIDPVAGAGTKVIAACVRSGGEFLVYGRLSANDVTIDIAELIRGLSVRFFMVDDFGDDKAKRAETASAIFQLLRQKVLEPSVGKKFQLEDFQQALKEAQNPERAGKVLLVT